MLIVSFLLFQSSENLAHFFQQDVSLYVQTFQVFPTKTLLPFLQKGGKTSELSFFILGKSGTIIQNSPLHSFLIFGYSR